MTDSDTDLSKINWSIYHIDKSQFDKEKIELYTMTRLLGYPDSWLPQDLTTIKNALLANKMTPFKDVIVFRHKGGFLAYAKTHNAYLNFEKEVLICPIMENK